MVFSGFWIASSKISLNKTINVKHEVILGVGFNLWNYKVDQIGGWTAIVLTTESKVVGLLDIGGGYRYFIKEFNGKSLFLENTIHGEFNTGNEFKKFKLSLEPGLGLKIRLSDRLKILSILNYKQALTDFYELDTTSQKPYSFGLGIGINKSW